MSTLACKSIDGEMVKSVLPKRKRDSHKGTYGKAAIVAGSLEYTGAAYLAVVACLRSGPGYTALFVPAEILPYYILKAPEVLLRRVSDGGRYAFNEEDMRELLDYDAVAYGMGMGASEDVAKGACWLLKNYAGRLILDADGLNSLSLYCEEGLDALFQNKKCDVVCTPHVKEFSRLIGKSVDEIVEDSARLAQAYAKAWGVTVLLKNAESVIVDETRCAVNTAGCSGQAKGGSGDVLSGVIAGLCAMGLGGYDGAVCGAYLCGTAAQFAQEALGDYSMTPTDVISYLGRAFLSL